MKYDMMYIETIFAPTQYQFERHLNSINSFIHYYQKYKYSFPVVFSGYCPKDEHFNIIQNELQKIGAICHREIQNVGKARILNTWIRQNINNHDFFWHSDHDILFDPDQVLLYDRLLEAFKHPRNKPIGITSLNQKEISAHIYTLLTSSIDYGGAYVADEKLIYNPEAGGIGGGSWVISKQCYLQTGGYREIDVYGGVDSMMHADAARNGFEVVVHANAFIIHPIEHDDRYKRWKTDVNRNVSKGIVHGSLENQIEKVNKFWAGI